MIRMFFAAAAVAAAALSFAPAAAADTPCGDAMSRVEYALAVVTPDGMPMDPSTFPLSPGASCSDTSPCASGEKCEGGSCCVPSGSSCSGLGYCCGHPSQGCVNGTCP